MLNFPPKAFYYKRRARVVRLPDFQRLSNDEMADIVDEEDFL